MSFQIKQSVVEGRFSFTSAATGYSPTPDFPLSKRVEISLSIPMTPTTHLRVERPTADEPLPRWSIHFGWAAEKRTEREELRRQGSDRWQTAVIYREAFGVLRLAGAFQTAKHSAQSGSKLPHSTRLARLARS